jgi:subfamily B ATP-binding cassette protein MsbA
MDGFGIYTMLPVFTLISGNSIGSLYKNHLSVNLVSKLFGYSDFNYLLFTLGVFICKSFLFFKIEEFNAALRSRFSNDLRSEALAAYSTISYEYHISKNSGFLLNMTGDQVTKATHGLYYYSLLIYNVFQLLIYTTLLFYFSPLLGTIMGLFAIILFLSFRLVNARIKIVSSNLNDLSSKFLQHVGEFFTAFKYLKATSNVFKIEQRIKNDSRGISSSQYELGRLNAIVAALREPITLIFLVGVYLIQSYMLNGSAQIVIVSMFLFYRLSSILMAAQGWFQLTLENVSFFFEYDQNLSQLKNNRECYGNSQLIDPNIEVSLSNIGYKYPGVTKYILHDMDFLIKKESLSLIIGNSGSGKTTLLNLITGLYRPNIGFIYYNNVSHLDIDYNKFRKLIGFVPQEINLFDGTILENVTMNFSQEHTQYEEDRCNTILKLVGLSNFMEGLNKGIFSTVGDSGMNISGGQRQRILLARELYREPKILFLDEATNALDHVSEQVIVDLVNHLKSEITIVWITHQKGLKVKSDIVLDLN